MADSRPDFKVGGVKVLVVWAENVEKTAHFYHDILGLEQRQMYGDNHGHMKHFLLEDSFLILLEGKSHPAENAVPAEFPLFALTVDNLDQAVSHLQAHDVALPRGVEGHEPNRWVMFHDTAGNLIELVQAH